MRPVLSPRWIGTLAALALGLVCTAGGGAAAPGPAFTRFAHTGIRLADIVWNGHRLLYVENTTNTIWNAGTPPTVFASMPKQTEETRCRLSPGTHGFPAGDLYCHAPDNTIYRIAPNGAVAVFAKLPETDISDGALTFDQVGRFGFELVAATGRSGAATRAGGAVYTIAADGTPTLVGRYAEPGGADEIVVAPANFGTGAGQLVLAVDAGSRGTLLLMDAAGHTRKVASLPDGPNPLVVVPARPSAAKPAVARGLYVTDTKSTNVFFAPAAALAGAAGAIVVGSELGGHFWSVRPRGGSFRTRPLPLRIAGSSFNLEGAVYVG